MAVVFSRTPFFQRLLLRVCVMITSLSWFGKDVFLDTRRFGTKSTLLLLLALPLRPVFLNSASFIFKRQLLRRASACLSCLLFNSCGVSQFMKCILQNRKSSPGNGSRPRIIEKCTCHGSFATANNNAAHHVSGLKITAVEFLQWRRGHGNIYYLLPD